MPACVSVSTGYLPSVVDKVKVTGLGGLCLIKVGVDRNFEADDH